MAPWTKVLSAGSTWPPTLRTSSPPAPGSGALLSLLLLVARPAAGTDAGHLGATHRALDGFARIGTIVVAVIVASGLANAWLLVGPSGLGALPRHTLWAVASSPKLALFAAMLGCAAMNRYRLAPMLSARIAQSDHRSAIVALRVSLALETGVRGDRPRTRRMAQDVAADHIGGMTMAAPLRRSAAGRDFGTGGGE